MNKTVKVIPPLGGRTIAYLRSLGLCDGLSALQVRELGGEGVWTRWLTLGCPFDDKLTVEGIFATYRSLRRKLRCWNLPHPDLMIKKAAAHLDPAHSTKEAFKILLGHCSWDEYQTIRVAQGLPPRKMITAAAPSPAQSILSAFPAAYHKQVSDLLEEVQRNGGQLPSDHHVARVENLPVALRLLGACSLVRFATEGAKVASSQTMLTALESVAFRSRSFPRRTPCRLLEDLQREQAPTGSVSWARVARGYMLAISSTRSWTATIFSGRAAHLQRGLPGCNLNHRVFIAAKTALAEREVEVKAERTEAVVTRIDNSSVIETAVNNRLYVTETIYTAVHAGIGKWLAGDQLLAWHVEAQVPVLRPDGSIVEGAEQIVSFRLESRSQVLRRAASKKRDMRRIHLMEQAVLEERRPPWTNSAFPEDVMVIYDGVKAVGGGSSVEPFFVEWYRWAIFEGLQEHPPLIAEVRKEFLEQAKFNLHWAPIDGFFAHPVEIRPIAKAARGEDPDDGEVIIPIYSLYHGMLLATLVHFLTEDTGGRSGELLQLRLRAECIGSRTIGGEKHYFVRLKPKDSEILKEYSIDEFTTLATLKKCALFSAQRWFSHLQIEPGTIRLPSRPVSISARSKELPHAEYIFQNHARTLKHAELNFLPNVLKWMVSHGNVHDERYGAETTMSLAGISRRIRAKRLHHVESSNSPERYDCSGAITAVPSAQAFGRRQRQRGQ